jgi:putative PIN family toxin of toxin-antitoxin system
MSERVVIDTNVLVAGLRSSQSASHRVLRLVGVSNFELSLSVPLVIECEDVLKRHAADLGLTDSDIEKFIDYLCSVAHPQEIHFLWRPFLRDPGDDHVLELAVESRSSMIVTHNVTDFVGCDRFGIDVIRPSDFLRRMGVET